jgi:phosphoglycerate dehydrogenase-like enzyme
MLEELDESHQSNVIITPHIAGGTIETRKRMFKETAEGIAGLIQNRTLDEMKEGE